MRVDGVRGDNFAGTVHDSHFHAGPESGIEAKRCPVAGRCGKQDIAQVGGEHANSFIFCVGEHASPPEVRGQPVQDASPPPSQLRGLRQPGIRGPPVIGDPRHLATAFS